MSIKLEKSRYLLAAIANALQTASESISLVRDAADEKEPFEKSLDYLWTTVAELKRRAARYKQRQQPFGCMMSLSS